jgi:tetratricopeptide (TPR) repeat protein
MSLTYSQKQFVQKQYPDKSVEEISSDLHVSVSKIRKHIEKNQSFFDQKKQKEEEQKDIPPSSFKEWLKKHWINLGILAGLIFIVYINAFTSDFVSDDIQGIVEIEKFIKTPQYIISNPSFILRSLQIFFSYKVAGLTPLAFRMYSFLAHIGFVWMIYVLVPYFSRKKYLPFMVASLAAVHPMMIESVTWISGGIYSQAALYILISFYFYIINTKKYTLKHSIFSWIFFVVGMSVSEKVIVFPGILFLYEYCYNRMSSWKRVVPYFGLSFLWLVVLLPGIVPRMNYLKATNGTGDVVQIYNPLTQIPIAIGTYFKLYIWPRHLTLYHSDFYRNNYELAAVIMFFIAYTGGLIYSFFTDKKIFFWFAFFISSLLVTMNPFGLSWVVAERYAYLGSFAVFFLVSLSLHSLIDNEKYKTLGFVLFVLLLVGFSIRTLVRNNDWRNVDNLWIATGKASPSDPKTHNNLGDMYARHGDMKMAIQEFGEAIRLNPGYAAAYYNTGNTYKHMKNDEEAVKYFRQTLEINPGIWQAYMNIAVYHFDKGEYDIAEKYILGGIKADPTIAPLYANLGVVYAMKGRNAEAKEQFKKALQIDPENQFALQWMQKFASGETIGNTAP